MANLKLELSFLCFLMILPFSCGNPTGQATISRRGMPTSAGSGVASAENRAQVMKNGQSESPTSQASVGEDGFAFTASANMAPRLRMKSNSEIFEAIQTAFAYKIKNKTVLPAESSDATTGFKNISLQLQVGESFYIGIQKLASEVKDGVSSATLKKFCIAPSETGVACANEFVANFGKILIGRNLESEEKSLLVNVFNESVKINDEIQALRDVLEILVQVPSFLYRTELGDPDVKPGLNKLSNFEIAAALSSFLWQAPPDNILLNAAVSGTLTDALQLEKQANRMFKDPKARLAFANFVDQWLEIASLETASKDAKLFPDYNPEIASAMRSETQTFIEKNIFDGDASLKTLFNSDTTYLNESLSKFYKIGVGQVNGAAFSKVTLPPERRGILSHGSLMTVTGGNVATSPIIRGLFVRRKLMCNILPPPPLVLKNMVKEDTAPKAKRDSFNQHLTPACAGCHRLVNPVGFGLENFDPIGRYRTVDNGFPIDSSGNLLSQSTGSERPYPSGGGIFAALAETPELASCFTLRMYQFALGRAAGKEDKETLDSLAEKFRASNFNITKLMTEIIKSDSFTARVSP